MNTLIAYATKYGCAEKCAKILAERLTGRIDLCNLKYGEVPDLSQYDKVIIGGSIYMGKIRKQVSKFCSRNLDALKNKKVGLFICGMLAEDEAETELNNAFPKELVANAMVKKSFGGEVIFKKLNPIERFIVKTISKADEDISAISEENINRFARLINGV